MHPDEDIKRDARKLMLKDEREEEFNDFLESGRLKINALLFEILPPEATIEEMDSIARTVYEKVAWLWEARKPQDMAERKS
jgi:hypothetical protein